MSFIRKSIRNIFHFFGIAALGLNMLGCNGNNENNYAKTYDTSKPSTGGGWISGGGDPLRMKIEEGQYLALQLVERLKPEVLLAGDLVDKWILSNKEAVSTELRSSKIIWTTEQRFECAKTEYASGASIELSIPGCTESIKNTDDAAKLFLHEVTHHLAVIDEQFADKIAIRLFHNWEKGLQLPWCSEAERRQSTITPENLPGTWQPNAELATMMGFELRKYKITELNIVNRPSEIELFHFQNVSGVCAYMAGRLTLTSARADRGTQDFPFVLIQTGGTTHLVFQESVSSDGTIDIESFYITMGIAPSLSKDILFVGGDMPNEKTLPYKRK